MWGMLKLRTDRLESSSEIERVFQRRFSQKRLDHILFPMQVCIQTMTPCINICHSFIFYRLPFTVRGCSAYLLSFLYCQFQLLDNRREKPGPKNQGHIRELPLDYR